MNLALFTAFVNVRQIEYCEIISVIRISWVAEHVKAFHLQTITAQHQGFVCKRRWLSRTQLDVDKDVSSTLRG